MSDVERQYDYKPETGIFKTLGGLMILLSPPMAYMSSQKEDKETTISGIPLTPGQAMFFGWVLSVALLYFGVKLVTSSLRHAKACQRVAFTPHAFIFPDAPTSAVERVVAYKNIADVSTSEAKGRRLLHFTHPEGKAQISSSGMQSLQAFEEMCAFLMERIQTSTK